MLPLNPSGWAGFGMHVWAWEWLAFIHSFVCCLWRSCDRCIYVVSCRQPHPHPHPLVMRKYRPAGLLVCGRFALSVLIPAREAVGSNQQSASTQRGARCVGLRGWSSIETEGGRGGNAEIREDETPHFTVLFSLEVGCVLLCRPHVAGRGELGYLRRIPERRAKSSLVLFDERGWTFPVPEFPTSSRHAALLGAKH